MLNIDIKPSWSKIRSEYITNYTIFIWGGGGEGVWVTGMWDKKGKK